MQIAYWHRTLYNAYEPTNTITLVAELVGKEWIVFELLGFLSFNDGLSVVSIERTSEGFCWRNAEKSGISPTMAEALSHMPAMVTHPDHWEEGEIAIQEQT